MVQDVTILRAAEAEHDRLTRVVARAEERERVAMDLHDGVLGSLAGVAYHLAGLASSATLTREQVIAELGAAHRQVTAVADELRQYTVGLRTPDAEPIQVDLRALAAVARGAGVAVHVDIPEHMTGLRADALIDLLHVAREAVANTLRHAAAKHLSIRVIVDADQLSLQVSDDGIGFDEALLGDRRGHGLGNMAVRARRMGAVLTVTSTPGAGTDVRLTLSLDTTTHRSSSG
jgi:signal transduction histidine kinase